VDFARDPLRNLGLLLFPALTLGLGLAAATMRMTRSAMLDVLSADYVRTARAKGLGPRLILRRHVLKNGLIVIVTLLGIQAGQLLGGAVVVEEIFSIPGIGRMLLTAIVQRDYALVQGGVLVIAMLFVVVNIFVDLLYGFLDPRIRLA
jgi:peptide/nickel transport system permease protein